MVTLLYSEHVLVPLSGLCLSVQLKKKGLYDFSHFFNLAVVQ